MGRPKQNLQKWCNTNVSFKIEFLDHECKKENGLVTYLQPSTAPLFIGEPKYFNQVIPSDITSTFQKAILANGIFICMSLKCFEQLKKQFIIYKKEQTKGHLVKKQYHFEAELSERIQNLKKIHGWAKEETVIEHVMNTYTNYMTYNKSKAQVETKAIKLQVLNEEIKELNQKLLTEKKLKEFYQNLCKEHGIDEIAESI